jgi:hypothetical protein
LFDQVYSARSEKENTEKSNRDSELKLQIPGLFFDLIFLDTPGVPKAEKWK